MVSRLATVTVGQAPRDDIVPEIVDRLHRDVEVTQYGVLDGLGLDDIAAMAPAADEARLCTRLKDGTEVITSKAKTGERLSGLLTELTGNGYDQVVLLCTGYFDNIDCPRPYLEAQSLVDGYVAAISHGGRRIGVMVPNEAQIREAHIGEAKGHKGYEVAAVTHASPYSGDRLAEAARELSDMDVIVMHCMGYTRAHREAVAAASGRPAVLARDVIAAGLDHLL